MESTKKTILKVVVIGDSGVGKTCLVKQYVHQSFNTGFLPTVGNDIFKKELMVDNILVALQIWDTVGGERYRSLGPTYYRNADCCVVVFDVTKNNSFDALRHWRENFLRMYTPYSEPEKEFPFVVIGNKIDLTKRAVCSDCGPRICQQYGNIPYFETSAKDAINVEQAFETITRIALSNEKPQRLHPRGPCNRPKQSTSSGCC